MPDLRAGLPAPARGDEVGLPGGLRAPWRIEKSFRMSKRDLHARPVYHHKRESIEAHLTIVFAALAVSHWIEHQTGWSIKKFVRTARRYRTAKIQAGQHIFTAADPLPPSHQLPA
jgi:transposase